MGRPAAVAVYRSVCTRLKRHFAFAATIAANRGVNGVLMIFVKQIVVLKAWPPSFGVVKHFRVVF